MRARIEMLTTIFAVAIFVVRLFPETPAGKWLHLYLVEMPLRWASRLERKYVIFALLIVIAGPTLTLAAPLDLALIYALDLSLYIDVVVAVGTAAVVTRGKMAWAAFKVRASSIMRANRTARPPSRKKRAPSLRTPRQPTNDDDAEPAPLATAA